MDYLWTKDVAEPSFPTLHSDMDTDVLVIGGGIAGVLCAYHLQQAGVKYALVEATTVGHGITKGTTAVLTAQHDTLYQDFVKKFGPDKTRKYLIANLEAVETIRRLSEEIPCDFEEKPSIMYSLDDRQKMEEEARILQKLGFHAKFTTVTPMPFPVAGGVLFPHMAQFHPLKFLYGLAKGLNIYEHTFVHKLVGTTAHTKQGTIRAKKIIIATHFPFINSHGLYFMKLFQQRSYVLALEHGPDLGCTIEDFAYGGVYLRNYKNLLLLGGGDHRTGKQGGSFAYLRTFAKEHFPKTREVFAWANQDCVSLDGMPYIGAYSAGLKDVYVASGFNLWGMTTSVVTAQLLTDLVTGRENPYRSVFDGGRTMLSSQLFSNIGTTILDFATPTTKRCSHMGCALQWNPVEHSWDCPCHGSRFDAHGGLIDNPAMRDSHVS